MSTPSNPGWATGYVPTTEEWTAAFSGKVDYPAPIGQGGTGITSTPTNGQLLIGTGSGFALNRIQSGPGISITVGPGSIRISNIGTSGAGTVYSQLFSGTGSQTAFTLAYQPQSEENTQVYVNGLYQQKNTYSLSGSTITFSTAPPLGTSNIEVVVIQVLPIGETNANLVNFTPTAWITSTNVQSAIAEIVNDLSSTAPGNGVALVSRVPYPVATRTALKAIDTTRYSVAHLTEAGREGTFYWTAGDFSSNVAADPLEGVCIKADAVASSSGAWVRDTVYLTPEMFGAKGDCVWNFTTLTATGTDDSAAVQAAIDYLQLRGVPGTVLFSRLYRITAMQSLGSMKAGLQLWNDGIQLIRDGAGIVGCAFDGGDIAGFDRGLHVSGGYKTGDNNAYANRCVDAPGFTLSGTYGSGVKSITLATAADAGNFVRGDVCYIRSGQTLLTGTTEPDAELLICRSADATTGVVTFDTRTAAPYCQERYLTGTSGRTTSGVQSGPGSVTAGAGGSNYVQATTAVVFSGGGTNPSKRLPTATATVNGSGNVTEVTITDPGEWLSELPTLTITSSGSGSGATGWAATFGNNAPYQLANVTDRVLRYAYIDIDMISNNLGQVLDIWGCTDVTVAPTARIWTGYCGAGSRDSTAVRWGGTIYATGRVNGNYLLAPSTGCSHWDIEATLRSNVWGYMHLHEGTKDMRLNLDLAAVGDTTATPPPNVGEGAPLTSIQSRAYGIYIQGTFDSGSAENSCIGMGEDVRGGVTFGPLQINSNRPNTAGSAIAIVNSPNVMFTAEPNIIGTSGRLGVNGGLTGTRTTLFAVRTPTVIMAPFLFNKTTEFFDLELDEYIESVIIQVDEAFTGGDRRLYIGYGARNYAFLSNVNLSTLGLATANLAYIYQRGVTGAGDRLGLAAPSQQRVQTYLLGGTTDYTAGKARITLIPGRTARAL